MTLPEVKSLFFTLKNTDPSGKGSDKEFVYLPTASDKRKGILEVSLDQGLTFILFARLLNCFL